jgi:hypothetical protein
VSALITALRHEFLLLRRDTTAVFVLALLAIAVAGAVVNGVRYHDASQSTALQLALSDQQRVEAASQQARALDASNGSVSSFRDPRNADVFGRRLGVQHARLPATPLAPLAIGQGDLLPRHYPVSLEPRVNVLAEAALTAPRLLHTGRFDMGFVVIVLAPLFIIALSHGVLTWERDNGLLRLLLVQQPAPGRWLLARYLTRLFLVGAPLAAAGFASYAHVGHDPDAPLRLALWVAVAGAYLTLWIAAAWWVGTWRISALQATLGLTGTWLLLVVIVPAASNVALELRHPTPPRIAYVDAMRDATDVARTDGSRALARYLEDHPELGQTLGPFHLHALEVVHEEGLIYTALGPYRSGLVVLYTVPASVVATLLPDGAAAANLTATIARGFIVFDGTAPCTLNDMETIDYPDIGAIQFRFDYACASVDRLAIDYRLFPNDLHENHVQLWIDGDYSSFVLRGGRRAFEIPLARMLWSRGTQLPDQPPLLPGQQGQALAADADFFALRYAVQQRTELALEPLTREFEARRAAHRRWAQVARFTSPALLAGDGLADAAGSGDARHGRFVEQVSAHHATWRAFFEPYIVAGTPFDAFERLPAFDYHEEPRTALLRRGGVIFAGLMVPALALLALAFHRSNRRLAPL